MTTETYDSGMMPKKPHNMSDTELKRFARLIYDECGIDLNPSKKSMLSARLAKRLRALAMDSFKEYYSFVETTQGKNEELVHMIDAVTTNTTHFFRERNHFEYLTRHALPALLARNSTIRIWSAGCSSGEEPYTLAMVLADYFQQHPGDFHITATDISTKVLSRAVQAIYDDEDVEAIPLLLKRRYMMRGKGSQAGRWRVVPELRNKIQFVRLNFMDASYPVGDMFDIIFCRNVIIYFDWETKSKVINQFQEHLAPGGYLFIGHSESLNGMCDQLRAVAPTIYRKTESDCTSARRVAA